MSEKNGRSTSWPAEASKVPDAVRQDAPEALRCQRMSEDREVGRILSIERENGGGRA